MFQSLSYKFSRDRIVPGTICVKFSITNTTCTWFPWVCIWLGVRLTQYRLYSTSWSPSSFWISFPFHCSLNTLLLPHGWDFWCSKHLSESHVPIAGLKAFFNYYVLYLEKTLLSCYCLRFLFSILIA